MSEYRATYEDQFVQNLNRYASLRAQVKCRVDRVLTDPYANTDILSETAGPLDLRGCRSARVDRNFRIILIICEECCLVPECE